MPDGSLPQLEFLDPDAARRVVMTISCRDADGIPKVDGAGEVFDRDGQPLQLMHNGLVIEEGCYFGPWMTEIVRALHGHHEPQEEVIFDALVRILAEEGSAPAMVEFGSFWTYYGMWFARSLPGSRVVGLEPDPAFLEVGRRNAALNDLSDQIAFVHGAVGAVPGTIMQFHAESDGQSHAVPQFDLRSLMERTGLDYVDLVLSDIQGAESILLDRARTDFAAGRVRFMIVSTHHHSISGDPLTHQRALALLIEAGAHVIAEHTVAESFSGDGLIAVSFDDRDKDLRVEISHARAKESLFGELEPDLDAAWRGSAAATAEAATLRDQLAKAVSERDEARAELQRTTQTRIWRWSKPARTAYARTARRLAKYRSTP